MGDLREKRYALIVEDEALISILAAEAMQELRFEAVEAGSAKAALNLASSTKFDVALIDIGLPDRRGDELVAELRSLQENLPVIIATGYADPALRDRFRNERRVVILNKPYDIAHIRKAIDALALK
jgi:DNA-binding response OmpR family regulator